MLRNLGILKSTLLRPTLSDQYKMGPGEVISIAIDINKKGRRKRIKHKKDNTISKILFIYKPLDKMYDLSALSEVD
jgi:uncharacterized UPF0146 family protein